MHKRRRYLKRWAKLVLEDKRDTLVYLDETGFDLTAQRDHGRAPPGQRVYGLRSGNRRPRTSLIGALVRGKLTAPMLFEGTTNTALFNDWIAQSLLPELSPGMTVILDNAAFHKSKTTEQLIRSAGCQLLFLPPYSPDLNPIETTWANIKNFRKHHHKLTLEEVIKSCKY